MPKPNYGYDYTTGEGQKRLMYESAGIHYEPPKSILPWEPGDPDYGADPLGDGTHRMVPSGDIVSLEERCRRLNKR
jgi:hypothetical protein